MATTPIDLLQQMPIFGALREDTLDFLLAQAGRVERATGADFVTEGEPASSMFVIERGTVTIFRRWRGAEFELRRLGVGDCFGEMAVMDLQPRSATVRALEPCHAIELTADGFLRLFERDAEQFALIQMNMGREVCRRLRATDELLFRNRVGDGGDSAWPEALI